MNRPSEHRQSEKGQVLVFLVVVIMGVLAFAALGIDGSLIYVFRRDTQNAVDAGVMNGGWKIADELETGASQILYSNWNCAAAGVAAAMAAGADQAKVRSSQNGYDIVTDPDIIGIVDTQCTVVDYVAFTDKFIDTTMVVTSPVPTAFVHMFFEGDVQNTVTAVSRIRPRTPVFFGYTIVALNPALCSGNNNGVNLDGSADSTVFSGGIFSAGCLNLGGTIDLTVNNTTENPGGIMWTSEFDDCGGACTASPAPEQTPIIIDDFPEYITTVQKPTCPGPNRTYAGEYPNLRPGTYPNIIVNGGDSITMDPGLYCLDGNFSMNANAVVDGNFVTIFMRSGDFTSNGGATIELDAAVNADNNGVPGVLIYMDESNTGQVKLVGDSSSRYTGTIYAPTGTIDVGGSGDLTGFETQLIGFNVKLHGSPGTTLTHGGQGAAIPATLNLEN